VSFSVPSTEPAQLAAGETWHWTKSFPGFTPGEGWAVTYYIQGPAKKTIVGTPQAASGDYDFLLTAANNEELPAGRYEWVALAVLGAEKHVAGRGILLVTPNLVTAPEGSLQTDNEQLLAAIRAKLYARVNDDNLIEQYGIHGRTVAKMPTVDLVKLEGIYAARVRAERNPGRVGTDIEFVFGQP
jgi:hypothetical protein